MQPKITAMKKLILMALLCLTALGANAQIQIQKTDKIVELTATVSQWNWLNKYGDQYLYSVKTDNRFDNFIFFSLGNTKEEAIASLQALIDAYETTSSDESLEVNEWKGDGMLLTPHNFGLGMTGYRVTGLGYAGQGAMYLKGMQKAIDYLNKH